MNAVAIDIGTYSLKAIHAKGTGDAPQVQKVVEVPNQLGLIIPSDEVSREKMTQQIETMITDHSLPSSDIRLALPESRISTQVITNPVLSDAELASAITWQAEQHIPIPKEDLTLEYQVLFRPDRSSKDTLMRVLLIGARKSMIDKYISMFNDQGIEPTYLETQTIALARVARVQLNEPPTLVAHFGFSTLDCSIIRGGELSFVFSYPNGGLLFNRALESALQLPLAQAEEYKRAYGLDPQHFEGKVLAALQPVTQTFLEYIQKATNFFAMQYPQEKIQRILLSGGSAQLPGLAPYLASALGMEVQLIQPFAGLQGALPQANHTAFSVCAGLLARTE